MGDWKVEYVKEAEEKRDLWNETALGEDGKMIYWSSAEVAEIPPFS